MAQDIIYLDPWKDKCPHCNKPILIEHQFADYGMGEGSEQFIGLKKGEEDENSGLSRKQQNYSQ